MAKEIKKQEATLDNLSNNSSLLIYGLDNTLENEDSALRNIINQTIISTKSKFGTRSNNEPINYFNEVGFKDIFSKVLPDGQKSGNVELDLKRFMNSRTDVDPTSLLYEDQSRLIRFSNYKAIYDHISECAQALDTYKDNIMSPDDFSKIIFDVIYDNKVDQKVADIITSELDDLTKKYKIEELADKVIEETLKYGESYVAVLSLDNEMRYLLSDSKIGFGTSLNESVNFDFQKFDPDAACSTILKESIDFDSEYLDIIAKEYATEDIDVIKDATVALFNENVKIGGRQEFILEEIQAKQSFGGNPVEDYLRATKTDNTKKRNKKDKPLGLNGSVIKYLDPSKVIELRIDNTCYGYYYVENTGSNLSMNHYLGVASGRTTTNATTIAGNASIAGTTSTVSKANNSAAQTFGIGEQKLKVISNIFLNMFAKKVDKEFIKKNKQLKDFIYDLVRENYIIKKGIKVTYLAPSEVVKFEAPAVYKNIVFYAKLYLSVLVNDLLVKLGRAHDKRVFYIDTGLGNDYEQAISKVIQDIKTKEYKMDNINDFNTILSLNPGRWDDYFMPTLNGDRPIDIETLPGMDTDLNSEFIEFLKNAMMSGMGVPRQLIDATAELDFARTVSAQNALFVRSVIKYQKAFTAPFSRIYQILYVNENRFIGEKEAEPEKTIDVNAIQVRFPSPASLAMSNLSDQIQAADGNAEFIASQLLPPVSDGTNEDPRVELKALIVKDLLPSIDWEKYEKLRDSMKEKAVINKINNPPQPQEDMGNDYY